MATNRKIPSVVREVLAAGGSSIKHGPFYLVRVPIGVKVKRLHGAPWIRLKIWVGRLCMYRARADPFGPHRPKLRPKLPDGASLPDASSMRLYQELALRFRRGRALPSKVAMRFALDVTRIVLDHCDGSSPTEPGFWMFVMPGAGRRGVK
jgi:hypothetical protein